MGDRSHKRRRVFVEDSRHNGGYLRATWHPERRIFTVSTWTGEVCTGAVRVPASQAPELVSLVVDGLAEVAAPVDAVPAAGPAAAARPASPPPPGPAARLREVLDAVRRWAHARVATGTSTGTAPRGAALPLRPPPAPGPVDLPASGSAGERTA